MALRSRPYILLLSHLYKAIIVSATTTVYFYTDASCKTPYATVHADTDAGNGPCGEFTTSVKSACSGWIDNGCSGTYLASLELLSTKVVLIMILTSHGLRGVEPLILQR